MIRSAGRVRTNQLCGECSLLWRVECDRDMLERKWPTAVERCPRLPRLAGNAQKNSAPHAVRPYNSTIISTESGGAGGEMGRETVMDEFVEAVRQVDVSERQVAEQRRIVDLLTEFGRDTTAAREQLTALEQAHAHNMSRRDQLRALLEE